MYEILVEHRIKMGIYLVYRKFHDKFVFFEILFYLFQYTNGINIKCIVYIYFWFIKSM